MCDWLDTAWRGRTNDSQLIIPYKTCIACCIQQNWGVALPAYCSSHGKRKCKYVEDSVTPQTTAVIIQGGRLKGQVIPSLVPTARSALEPEGAGVVTSYLEANIDPPPQRWAEVEVFPLTPPVFHPLVASMPLIPAGPIIRANIVKLHRPTWLIVSSVYCCCCAASALFIG